MVAEIYAGLSAFKTMFDLAKGLKDISDAAIRNGAIIELQEHILSAQAAQSTLVEHVRTLEKRVADFETWDAEKQEYELTALASGSFAYALKPDTPGSKPPHLICANCYEHRKKSILQKKAGSTVSAHLGKPPMYVCPACRSEIVA